MLIQDNDVAPQQIEDDKKKYTVFKSDISTK